MKSTPAMIMGILNCTPDSFFDGDHYGEVDGLVRRGLEMLEQGADILDVGGESTRPGSNVVSVEDELERVMPVITQLRSQSNSLISIDTSKFEVAEAALIAGANIVNDVTAGTAAQGMFKLVAKHSASIVLMHMQGNPQTMQKQPEYQDVVSEVIDYLSSRANAAISAGVDSAKIIIDPGIGFGKSFEHNAMLISKLDEMTKTGYSLLFGASRKSLIEHALGLPVEDRMIPSLALAVMAAERGASILRVHDVRETVLAVRMAESVLAVGE